MLDNLTLWITMQTVLENYRDVGDIAHDLISGATFAARAQALTNYLALDGWGNRTAFLAKLSTPSEKERA